MKRVSAKIRAAEAQRYQALNAYRKILRWIHERGLVVGDRLPPQSDLIRQLCSCHGTLSEAMRWLVADGVLTRRQRFGTVVTALFPLNPLRRVWTVGIVTPSFQASPFFSVLAHSLHRQLAMRNCTDRTYMLSPRSLPGEEVDSRGAADFTGLAEDISGEFIDGVVTATRLVNRQIPVCGIAGWETPDFGIVIDESAFVRSGANELVQQGGTRLALVTTHAMSAGYSRLVEGCNTVRKELPHCRLDYLAGIASSGGIRGGFQAAEQLLRLPAGKRPEGLLVPDDMVAQGLTFRLREAGGYAPLVAVQTHLQTPSVFSLPIISLEIDLEFMAQRAVDLLLARMINPRCVPEIEWYQARVRKCGPEYAPQLSEGLPL